MSNDTLEKMWNILKENDFQIDAITKSEITCTSCKNVLIKPYNVPCGCRYCYDCLIGYLNGEEIFCLGDSEFCKTELIKIDTNVFIDQRANIKISKIVVKCPMESCEFKIELGKMADHMRTCDRQTLADNFYDIECHEDKIVFEKMKQHFTEENYSHSRLLMDFVDNWRNEIKLLKTDIKKQMNSKQETISALEENVVKLLQGNRYLENNQKQMEIKIENLFEENKFLRDELKTVKRNMIKQETVLSIQTKVDKQERKIMANTETVENLKQRFDCKCDQIETNEARLNTTVNKMSQENAMEIHETKVTQIQENPKFDEFLWCIKYWDEKIKQAQNKTQTEIYSDPFYSHKNGYKMCLKLCPDGFDNCKGTHLSLFVTIMHGEFDNILKWPFLHEVKLELLNQETGFAHISKNVDCNYTSITWKKPTNERCAAFGYYRFIELSELRSNSALFQGNQILIRATSQLKL